MGILYYSELCPTTDEIYSGLLAENLPTVIQMISIFATVCDVYASTTTSNCLLMICTGLGHHWSSSAADPIQPH